MAVKLAFVVLLLAVVGVPAAHAEKAKANQSTSMFNRKGEAGKVLVKLKAGQVVNVLKKEGRWLQVRAMGRRGWVPQSTIDVPDDDAVARNTRRRPSSTAAAPSAGSAEMALPRIASALTPRPTSNPATTAPRRAAVTTRMTARAAAMAVTTRIRSPARARARATTTTRAMVATRSSTTARRVASASRSRCSARPTATARSSSRRRSP